MHSRMLNSQFFVCFFLYHLNLQIWLTLPCQKRETLLLEEKAENSNLFRYLTRNFFPAPGCIPSFHDTMIRVKSQHKCTGKMSRLQVGRKNTCQRCWYSFRWVSLRRDPPADGIPGWIKVFVNVIRIWHTGKDPGDSSIMLFWWLFEA